MTGEWVNGLENRQIEVIGSEEQGENILKIHRAPETCEKIWKH
jgi:hypothetical protein